MLVKMYYNQLKTKIGPEGQNLVKLIGPQRVNVGVANLTAWLNHSCQKTEVAGKQGHAPCRRILLQQIPMTRKSIQVAPSPRQLLNGHRVQIISGFKSECHGIKFSTLNVGSLCGRKAEVCEELRKRKVDVCCIQKVR